MRDTGSVFVDAHYRPGSALLPLDAGSEHDRRTLRGVRHGVAHQVIDRLGDPAGIDADGERIGELERHLNIALHGLEDALGIQWKRQWNGSYQNRTSRALVRYADDLVVYCRSQDDAEAALRILRAWLANRGPTLSQEKTRIVHPQEGFDFLGFTIRRYPAQDRASGEILLIRPSRESLQAFLDRMKAEWMRLVGRDVATVVKRLNPIIKGWGTYFRVRNVGQEFSKLDHLMFQRELRYGMRQHPHKGLRWIERRYFGQYRPTRADRWVFGDKETGTYLWRLAWMTVVRHILVAYRASPDDTALAAYWEARAKQGLRTLLPSRQRIAARQGGKCPVCGEALLNGEELQTHHIQPRREQGTDAYDNLRLVHL